MVERNLRMYRRERVVFSYELLVQESVEVCSFILLDREAESVGL